ncbi:MAG: cell division protein FtsL [Polyangiaceae bacterium]|nr:cell division protein FtsL [Polyangiaceae bacterium]
MIENSSREKRFVLLWSVSVVAMVCAFVTHLALRGRVVSMSYELGKARTEQIRLREMQRVLEVESSSLKTPERVEIVARTLLEMQPLAPERLITLQSTPGTSDQKAPEKQGSPSPSATLSQVSERAPQ